MASDNIETTKGVTSSTVRPTSSVLTNNAPEHGSYTALDNKANSPLELFQWLVGIHTPPCLVHPSKSKPPKGLFRRFAHRLAHPFKSNESNDNIGLYQRTKDNERRSRIAYLLTSTISNTLFLIQIMLAAAFTGLSAYKEANAVTLTILGAFNTVVAGCLAWQKGQGVPQRYHKAQDQYQALILEIEMAERSFIDLETSNNPEHPKLEPRLEKARLQKLYDTAWADEQANYPDLYVSTAANAAKANVDIVEQLKDAKAAAAKASDDMAKQMKEANDLAEKMRSDLSAEIRKLAQQLEAKVADRVGSAVDAVLK